MKKIILSLSMLAAVGAYAQNTGIGTTNPTEKLEVAGNIKSTTINSNTGAATDKVVVADGNGVLKSVARGGVDTNAWQLTGNSITAGQFIGTTNDQDVVFKRNSISSGLLSIENVFLGNDTSTTSQGENTGVGWYVLHGALPSARYNTGIGAIALAKNTSGNGNTAVGVNASYQNQTGNDNTAIGYNSLISISTLSNSNTALGAYSATQLLSGSNNIIIGYNAEVSNNNSNQMSIGNSIYGLNINDGDSTNDLIGIQNTAPKETLDVAGTVKIGTKAAYSSSTITAGATTPVPYGGAGTIVFQNSHFFGWDGSVWKQLDN